MSDSTEFGFARLVPGFDFLQNLAKGASQSMSQMPHLSNWVAPTLNVEELDKRIGELKAVQFWLDQNGKALGATIQALEVQKMTLATLQNMNFSMGELADALKLKTAETAPAGAKQATAAPGAGARAAESAPRRTATAKKSADAGQGHAGDGTAPVDPLQWWGALTQQFQQIAATAMQEVAQKTAPDREPAMSGSAGAARSAGGAGPARPTSGPTPAAPRPKKAARKSPVRKSRPRTTP